MAAVFELFHLSLLEKDQKSLFSEHPTPARNIYLRTKLSDKFTFKHSRKTYHWVPSRTDEKYILGHVLRAHTRRHHTPPEEGGFETSSDEWQGAIVIIDPEHHADGQKIAFERDHTLGKAEAVLRSMLRQLNSREDDPFLMIANPIFDERSFWTWAEQNDFRLKKIAFRLTTPNMFGVRNGLDEDLKELGTDGVANVSTVLDTGDRIGGINAKNDQIQEVVAYAAEGGGTFSAKSMTGDHFHSTQSNKVTIFHGSNEEKNEIFRRLRDWIPRLLGRESGHRVDSDN